MSIRLQIVTNKWDPVSTLIRFRARNWPSHVEFVDTKAGTTLGARLDGGVKIRPCSWDHYSRVEQFTALGINEAYNWALTQVGKKYDWGAILSLALDRDWHDESRWFCSEFVCVAFEKAGHPLLSTRPSNRFYRIEPNHLLMSRQLDYLKENQ